MIKGSETRNVGVKLDGHRMKKVFNDNTIARNSMRTNIFTQIEYTFIV